MTVVTQDDAATSSLAASMGRFLHGLAPADSWEPLLEQVPHVVEHCVEEMQRLAKGHEAFDVLVMARQRCLPVFGPHRESTTSVPYAVVDVIALVLLGSGLPQGAAEPYGAVPAGRTAEIIEPLCSLAHEVLRIATLASFAEASRLPDGLAELVSTLRSSETQVRGRQYRTIAADLNGALLGQPVVEQLLLDELGFTYADLHAVGMSVTSELARRYISARDDLGTAAMRGDAASPAEVEAGKAAAEALFIHPSRLHTVTVEEVAALSGVDASRVALVLDHSSVSTGSTASSSSARLIRDLVDGHSAMAGRTTVRRTDGEYLVLADAVPEDEIRRSIEPHLKTSPRWKTYDRRRATFAEDRASELLARLLGIEAPTHTNFKYYVPRRGASSATVAADATQDQLRVDGEVAEADALLVVDHVAVCLEVKAGSLPAAARRGRASALSSGLKRTVVGAADQAERLRRLVTVNGGLWTEDHEWLDLHHVREVHLVVVCLDDLGPLGVAGDALVRAGMLPQEQRAWIVSLHDLVTVSEVLLQPAQFLAYLRRRTEAEAARWLVAMDELDVLMWFVQGNLYFEPDPEAMHRKHPGSRPPTTAALRRYRRQSRTRIGTLTDDLDVWMSRDKIDEAPPRPERTEGEWVQRFLTVAREHQLPGWLTVGADLVGLSGPAQSGLTRSIHTILRNTASDGQPHSVAHGTVTPWGYWLLIAVTPGVGDTSAQGRLRQYLAAKKHQVQADQALGLILDDEGQPVYTCLLDEPWREDLELDALVATAKLVPKDRAAAVVPPSARGLRGRQSGVTSRQRRRGKRKGR